MIDPLVVDLSRWQFALTAMYHFLFVPLTLGLSFMLVIMECTYVMTGRQIWRDITKFWGVLFGVNFALGVATGITMEFQFGMNWSQYSIVVGDVFGAPLAIEGLMAFFLEATFVGLMVFGWDKMGKFAHLGVTFMTALGANLSALWILVANGWMQNPVGAEFNPDTMRMELVDFGAVIFNPVAQAKFVHTVSAGYVTGALFVLSVSAFYLLSKRHQGFAKRSITVASAFGLASALSVVVLGDESGYALTDNQKMKLAAIEAECETHVGSPAGLTVVGIPRINRETGQCETASSIKIPWVMGLIATRSLDGTVSGIQELVAVAETRIENGLIAEAAFRAMRTNPGDEAAADRAYQATVNGMDPLASGDEAFAAMLASAQQLGAAEAFAMRGADRGYASLLRQQLGGDTDIMTATSEDIARAAWITVPNVPVLFWTFRVMAGLGFYFIALFFVAFMLSSVRNYENKWFLRIALFSLPLPWIAAQLGWLVAELGRQPWVVEGQLPTYLAASSLQVHQIVLTMVGFTVLYGALAVVEIMLMVYLIRKGPYGDFQSPARGGHSPKPASAPASLGAQPATPSDFDE